MFLHQEELEQIVLSSPGWAQFLLYVYVLWLNRFLSFVEEVHLLIVSRTVHYAMQSTEETNDSICLDWQGGFKEQEIGKWWLAQFSLCLSFSTNEWLLSDTELG